MSRLLLLVVLFFSISNGDELNKFTNLDLAIKEAKVEKKDILIIFHGKQCHYCDKMKKNTLTDNEVIKFINNKYIFVSIDEDDNPNKNKFILKYIPATYILEPKTQNVKYYTYGYRTPSDFIGELTQNLK